MTRIALCLALALTAAPAAAYAAPRSHPTAHHAQGATLAACEARVAHSVEPWNDAPPEAPDAADQARARALGLGEIADRIDAAYAVRLAAYKDHPQANYQYFVWVEQRHHCHGEDMGLDQPLERTITVTGKIYGDGSVTATIE